MNGEMAYLLGMITGNGEIQRGPSETTVSIEIPHRKIFTEKFKDVSPQRVDIYVKASITDIRNILEPLLGTSMEFSQAKNVSIISFRKRNEDYLIREINRYMGNATSSKNVRISEEVFHFNTDERKSFTKT